LERVEGMSDPRQDEILRKLQAIAESLESGHISLDQANIEGGRILAETQGVSQHGEVPAAQILSAERQDLMTQLADVGRRLRSHELTFEQANAESFRLIAARNPSGALLRDRIDADLKESRASLRRKFTILGLVVAALLVVRGLAWLFSS
jgi:hypothetical protein